ncbi:hypothetical protein BC941DRAFT_129007 [Chlamydoabsidia padenii]|nr:hypothetical protein BC941DRAFT_129007 [Chlamydoabsidia padenii]
MRSVVISLLLVIIYVSITRAATMGVRAYLGCSLVKNQIHCFGGYTGVDSESSSIYQNPSADHFYLDMSTFNFNDTSTAMSNWTITKDSATLEATGFVQATSMANQSKLLLYGGTSPTGSNLLNPFMMYDPVSGNWDSVTTYGNYTRFGSFVNLDDTQKVWTWGGVFNATWNVTSYAYTLSFQTLLWEPIAGDTANTYTRYQHSSTLVPSKNTIYILGGMNRNLEPGKVDFGADMLEVRTFNTMTSSWGTLHATVSNGQNITPRNFHTATPITNTTVFLIYGGDASDTRNTAVLNDYAYLFDYSNNVYTPVNFDAGIGAGARTGHVGKRERERKKRER